MRTPRDQNDTVCVRVVDSHTEGEPTRVVVGGAPDLGGGSVAAQARVFRERFDWFRSAVVNEPRGFDAMVGALLVPPGSDGAATGVIFFNNVGLLNACGHGTIGLGVTLRHLGIIRSGSHVVETPVGHVTMHVGDDAMVTIDNVASYRHRADVEVIVEFEGRSHRVQGDVAWGGNWFFLSSHGAVEITPQNLDRLGRFAGAIKAALRREGVTGAEGAEVDHIELFGPPSRADCDSRNFVLCPGNQYDRSPCGTGTSAKLACLHARGTIGLGDQWRQESIIGSRFVGSLREIEGTLIPSISGRAYVCAESTLLMQADDPFAHGIRM